MARFKLNVEYDYNSPFPNETAADEYDSNIEVYFDLGIGELSELVARHARGIVAPEITNNMFIGDVFEYTSTSQIYHFRLQRLS